jgi:hypothetical protein
VTLHVWGSLPAWGILVVLVIRLWLVRTQSASVTWLMVCCAFVALGLTINLDALVDLLSAITHVPNIADVISRCLTVCGLFALAQSVEAAARTTRLPKVSRFVVCGLVLVALIVLFALINAPATTDRFMQTYGGQIPTALYSATFMVYIAGVLGFSAVAVLAEFRQGRGASRMYWLFVVGAVGILLLALIAIALDSAHVLGAMEAVGLLRAVYNPVFLLSMVFLAIGAAGGVLPAAAREFRDWREAQRRVRTLEPELLRLEGAAGHRGIYFTVRWPPREWRSRLHRLSVEIEDRAREAGEAVPAAAGLESTELLTETTR